jgi:hypothetical protein
MLRTASSPARPEPVIYDVYDAATFVEYAAQAGWVVAELTDVDTCRVTLGNICWQADSPARHPREVWARRLATAGFGVLFVALVGGMLLWSRSRLHLRHSRALML